jgi:tetratricopeptide (TPR) repeat protein
MKIKIKFLSVIFSFACLLAQSSFGHDRKDGEVWVIDDKPRHKKISDDSKEVLDTVAGSIKQPEEKEITKFELHRGKENKVNITPTTPEAAKDKKEGKVNFNQNGYTYTMSEVEPEKMDEEIHDITRLVSQAYRALDLGQTEAAKEYFKKALKKEPANVDALFGLGAIYQQEDQMTEAKALYGEALDIEPNNVDLLNNYLVLLGKESPDEAIKELEKLEKINKQMPLIPMQIGLIYADQKNYKKAIKFINRAIMLDPENVMNMYNAAIVLDKMGDYDQAVSYYEYVLEMNDNGKPIPTNAQTIKERIDFLNLKK